MSAMKKPFLDRVDLRLVLMRVLMWAAWAFSLVFMHFDDDLSVVISIGQACFFALLLVLHHLEHPRKVTVNVSGYVRDKQSMEELGRAVADGVRRTLRGKEPPDPTAPGPKQ